MKNTTKNKNGFSLIELLIAVSIFLIITVAAIGSMIHLQGAAERGKATYAVIDNLNLTIDSVSRLMRTGTSYHCDLIIIPLTTPHDCPNNGNLSDGAQSFAFLDQSGTMVQYKLSNDSTGAGFIEMKVGDGEFVRITSNEVNINRFQIYIEGSDPADTKQPYATILVAGTITAHAGKVLSGFNIETSVSQRTIDGSLN